MADELENKVRCQSCGMPLSDKFDNYGTNADGSKSPDFCSICFQKGEFTNPNQTLEEMIQSSVNFMSSNLGFTSQRAEELSREVIPNLKRWKNV